MMHGTIHFFDRLPLVDIAREPTRAPVAAPVRAEPLVGLIRNQHSHRNGGSVPVELDMPNVLVASPTKRSELFEILAEFAEKRVDYIAVDGGDGTVRDVLTCGASAFGDTWPAIIVLPSGKTNALAHDLAIPDDWTLADALEAAKRDSLIMRRPIVVAQRDNTRAQVRGFVLGAGAYSSAITLGQQAHSYGAFDALAVGMTAVWSGLQAFFGGENNPWRRGVRMRLRDEAGNDLPHVGGAPASERYLVFASTLRNFPAGMNPFRGMNDAMHLAVFDNSRRRLLLALPKIFGGTTGPKHRELGYHTHGMTSFQWDIADSFILDGEAFPPGSYTVSAGPRICFVVP